VPFVGAFTRLEAGGGTRTHGLLITNQLLYQLSYSGVSISWYGLPLLTEGKGQAEACPF
jgi:hypothetical protein